LTVQNRDGPPVSRRPAKLAFSTLFQPSDATRLDKRENFRAAVFLWITPRATPRAISGCTAFSALAASAFFPDAIADSTALMKVGMRMIRLWLISVRFAFRRMRLLACGVFAIVFL
jgi:hypothetical protein